MNVTIATFEKSVAEIRRAILREHAHGVDIGELLVAAVSDADKKLRADYRSVTDNRPGSWEASIVGQLVQPEYA